VESGEAVLHLNTTKHKREFVMKKTLSVAIVVVVMLFASLAVVRTASAEEVKMTGVITKIELAADGKSAIAVIKDNKTEELLTITVSDEQTLDKFKDKRILEGDEIRTKFEKDGDKNSSKMFKKTAGC
jgi:hypothetical protein